MKRRVKITIIVCVVFALLSSAFFLLLGYLSDGGHPGINSESFAPVKIKKVPDEEDIMVHVYPVIGMMPHGYEPEEHWVSLNSIKKGWIIAQYKGNCRVLFDVNDADMEDFFGNYFIEQRHHYYYVQPVSRDRLKVTGFIARSGDEPEDPFAEGKSVCLLDCCVSSEIGSYRYAENATRICLAANAVFILLAAGINLIANAVEKRKYRG